MSNKGWILPYLKENKRLFLIVILLGLVTVISSASLMFTSGFLISKAATQPETILMIYVPIVAVRTFGISRAVSKYVERLTSHDAVLKILSSMRVRVYKAIEPFILSPQYKLKTGDLLGVLADDIERLQDIYIKTVFPSLVALFLYTISLLVLGVYSVIFAVIMAIYGAVLVFLFPLITLLVTKSKVKQLKKKRHHLYVQLTDAVMGISEWQFSGRQNEFIQSYEMQEKELVEIDSKKMKFTRWKNTIAQLLIAVMVVSMLAWTAQESGSGSIPYTFIAAFVLILFPLTEVFVPISDSISEIPSYHDSYERLSQLSNLENRWEKETAHDSVPASEAMLEWNHVSFHYDNRKILDGLSLSILRGEKVALLGPSGAGKSTIVTLVEGVIPPSEGSIKINGVEATSLKGRVSNWVAILNQQPYIFDTSILNNIRLGKPSATDEEVYWAARQVQLHEYIESLPNSYHTSLHETGIRFSGGERQRIALARVLLQDTPIIILDEPTVGLDPVTEKQLLETIFDVCKDKTILWITHHLTFINRSNRVLFLEHGKITVDGIHEDLLKENERYRRLYRLDGGYF